MKLLYRSLHMFALTTAMILLLGDLLLAQEKVNRRMYGTIPSVSLVVLDEVSNDLKLDADTKEKVAQLEKKMKEERTAILENFQGDFEQLATDITKLYESSHTSLLDALTEQQKKRMREIYLQVNSSSLILDESVVTELKITPEQKKQLEQAADDARADLFDAIEGFQSLPLKQKIKTAEELVSDREGWAMEVLTEEQKTAFEKLKGEKIEIDLSKIEIFGAD